MPEATEKVDLTPGSLYQFAGIMGKDNQWAFPPAVYRFLGIALDYRTQQERVVYQGVGGRDDGKYFVAGLGDWHGQFKRIIEKAEPPAEKAAGFKSDKMW